MKSAISILLVLVAVTLCFFGCSNVPKEPATTTVENHSYVNPYGDTVAPPSNAEEGKETETKYLETVNDVEFVMSSYYVYNNCVAKVSNIYMEYDSMQANEVMAFADIEITGKSLGEEFMRIGYTAYDKDGNVVRNSFFQAKLKGVGKGDVVEKCPLDFPEETVKVVFFDYVED